MRSAAGERETGLVVGGIGIVSALCAIGSVAPERPERPRRPGSLNYRRAYPAKGRAVAPQPSGPDLAAGCSHPGALVGAGTPTLRGRTTNEAIAMPSAPSLERDSASWRRTSEN